VTHNIKILNLILIFIAIFFVDGLVLSGIFGFRESVMTLVFLAAMILNWGAITPVLGVGSVISLFLEFFWKMQPGSLMLMFLSAALIFFFISSFFNVKRIVGASIISLCLLPILGYNNFVIPLETFAAFAICFFLFDRVVEVRNS